MWVLAQSLAFAPNFSQAKLSAARLFQLLDRIPKLLDGPIVKEENWRTEGKVKFTNVSFSVSTCKQIIDEIKNRKKN